MKHRDKPSETSIGSGEETTPGRPGWRRAGRSLSATAALVGLLGAAAGPVHAKFDAPTGAPPSPLFGAQPFTQKILMFEEFGTRPLPASATAHSLPDPLGCNGPANPGAYTTALDSFLGQPLYPAPTRTANAAPEFPGATNPWAATVSGCLGRPVTGVLEGRPPGENFAHQRWSEFFPQVYFQTVQAGSRPNGGIRDGAQLHRYQTGEFGPGGLYHNTVGPETEAALGIPAGTLNGTTRGIEIRFHPSMPVQSPLKLWTFDGTLPPKLLMAPYGTPILNRHYNALPISDAANGGFGKHTITTHEHNGHNPAESDGFAGAFFFPGQFYDYHWPMVLAGHDSINTDASDPRAGTPLCADPRPGNCATPGGIRNIRGDWREMASSHWFHDHMVDFTAQNVYKGNATMMNLYSSVDRGREPANAAEAAGSPDTPGYGCHYANSDNVNLCLPSGSGLDWGNRDYDINLVVADKAFDAQGQLWFNTFNLDGFIGDVVTVNFLYKPYIDVRARKYRFRILNGSVSRYWKIALVDAAGNQVPFHMISNDDNLLEHAVPFPNVQSPEGLPEQSIAERYEIIVDFSRFKEGDRLYLVNLLEHQDGKSPKQAIPLAQVLSGDYSKDGCPDSCDPVVGKFMEIRVHAYNGVDLSMNPADYEEGKKKMVPLPGFTAEELAGAKERTFEFTRGGDVAPWTVKTDGGQAYNATSVEGLFDRVSAAPDVGSVEIWHIRNGGQGWSHPVHIHFEEGQILQRGGKAPPMWEKGARKDMYRIGPLPDSTDSVDVAIRVREFLGTYVEHCHNTQHEDHAMLLRWDSQNPGQTVAIQTPFPSWDGVTYLDSNTTDVPTFKTGQDTDFLANVAAPIAANDSASTSAGTAVRIPVTANDTCVGACDPASLVVGSNPANGTAAGNGDGSVTYTPAGGFTGTDSFTYTVRDTTTGTQVSNVATVTVTVGSAPPPPAPVAVADTATTVQDTVVGINVTANDSNCGSGCTVAIVTAPLHGTAVANSPAAGQVTYTPTAGFTGSDGFTYTATNAGGTSGPANVSVSVTANPLTDVVTITQARLQRNGSLSVKGTVTALNNAFAPTVEVFAGPANASHTGCTGTSLGTAQVNTRSGKNGGSWSFAAKGVSATSVCVQSANLGVADAPL
jgi:FtsP/CotA-like multicopper oxidase with cupredoxin domain